MLRNILFVVLVLFFPAAAGADVIVFKSGKTAEGLITKVTETGVTMQAGGDLLGVSYTQIKDIHESTDGKKNSRNLDLARSRIGAVLPMTPFAKGSKKVDLYMTSWCSYCKRMMAFLDQRGIRYTAYNIETNSTAKQEYSRYGGNGVPVTVVGGQAIHGYDPQAVLAAMK